MSDASISRTESQRTSHPPALVAMGIGALAGSLSGLFGVGGGILIVPALAIFTRMERRVIHGTSLAATAPLALAGLVGYLTAGEIDWTVAGLMLVGSLVGAVVGTSLLQRLATKWLTYGFVALLLLAAVRMLVETPSGAGREQLDLLGISGFVGLGLFSGAIAGLMGVGGGIIMVPAQILLFSVPSVLAKGTSLAVIVPTAVMGTTRNLRNGNVEMKTALRVGLAGSVFSFVASQLSLQLDPKISSVLFSVLLLVAAGRLVMKQRG